MACLFSFPILTEPDIQRLAVLILEATDRLKGPVFSSAIRIPQLNIQLRQALASEQASLTVSLSLESGSLQASWQGYTFLLLSGIRPPGSKELEKLQQDFKDKSQTSNPDLLRIQNETIRKKLQLAREEAQKEIRTIEQQLLHRKKELDLYIKRAETDSLTGLFNRGAYDRLLHETIRQLQYNPRPFSLIFLDLDYFKEVNDTFGHAYGDEVLRSMAFAMRTAIREGQDLACRIGGDEFAILLFADTEQAERIARSILSDMDRKVSIGIAVFEKNDTPEILAHKADQALYHAKENGRGRISMAGTSRERQLEYMN
ncbi:diguanylate cyclase (GGDEF)-like protein [Desulfobotulus alkaliphilus]|uniref:diguanylate cyclase n=1 Tax=Desulfobotulus alkaliphilus TaxID=622671 RepID=A0A562S9Y8_9BACT|nr:GGDEF domain-containing protein [Desulfobotulus alkaliphilus]TWI77326.1 diguanylate cyclase (GGDEF)-like protein [Desulfobotulus alkaliphilus]